MALDANVLANRLHNTLRRTADAQNVPTSVSKYTLAYAQGIVAALKSAVVSNLPGTINGITSPGSPLDQGSGVGGLMVITPGPMLAKTVSAFPPQSASMLSLENVAIITYIGTALINFAAGNITGTCGNGAESPGPLNNGAGSGGKLSLINGPGAYAAVLAAVGFLGPDAILHYTALINYILEAAEVTYPSGSVVGVCPPGGGPLTAGAGTGGIIS